MSVFKCKMCGGALEIREDQTTAVCEYCGTKQTLPSAKDENLLALFNRANVLRLKCEFDKAEQLYEKIIQSDSSQAEAYWGLILCKFGIEYVEDPTTFHRIPTCHRTSLDSIIADEDYKSALEHADFLQKEMYEQEAKEIDRLQKEILAVSQKEEPYDVFICYKETDENGKRTPDSVIANDIYYQLTGEGFKVFFAAITLESKLGSAYEPCIFAALNSAKVMLAIGTKPEYFNAVWVKNEWGRFLKLMKTDRSKLLIPCYKGMDAYELPEEFAHLQAQDMGKIGFINDITRGIKKVVAPQSTQKQPTRESAATPAALVAPVVAVPAAGSGATVESLLKRAFMYLEDGEWTEADKYCEKVLDIDPENARAYLGELMAELCCKKQEELKDCEDPFDDEKSYQKVMRFGDEQLKKTMQGYIDFIIDRNETARKTQIYENAAERMSAATTESDYQAAAGKFESIRGFRDADKEAAECRKKAEIARKTGIYENALKKMNAAATESDYQTAAEKFKSIRGFRDAAEKAEECREKAEAAKKDAIYDAAKSVQWRGDIAALEAAIEQYTSISGWKDADEQITVCRRHIEELKAEAAERERKAEEERIAKEKRRKRNKKIAIITTPIVCAVIAVIIVLNAVIIPNGQYNAAVALMDIRCCSSGHFSDCIDLFSLYTKEAYKAFRKTSYY